MPAPLTRLAARVAPPLSDGELLSRFARDRDEAAFAALVRRHGPTVYGVCRRVLGRPADADDAFQAVFLVLVERASTLAGRPALGDWLYGVAVRVALKARTAFARRRKYERRAAAARGEAVADPAPPEAAWLDRELAALPAKFRGPVVLCLVQGRPRAEVAELLCIPEGTLASRLDTARKRLAARLARYRVPLALGGLLVPVPAATAAAAVGRAADGAGVLIHQLAHEVSHAMTANGKWTALMAAGVLAAAAVGLPLAAGFTTHTAATDAPLVRERKEPAWKREIDRVYSLDDGELVKIIPRSEQPAGRRDFLRDSFFSHGQRKPADADKDVQLYEKQLSLVIEVDVNGRRGRVDGVFGLTKGPANVPGMYAGVSFLSVPNRIGRFQAYEIEPDTGIPGFDVGGVTFLDNPDFVFRNDAPREKLVPALDAALKAKLDAKFSVELKDLEKEVWVAAGKLDFKPRAWRKAGQVDVYSDEANVNKETFSHAHNLTPGHETGTVKPFLDHLRVDLQTWIVWADGEPPAGPKFGWAHHWVKDRTWEERVADRDPEKVLKNVAEQTGLTFTKEKRKVPVLVVGERK